MTPGSVLAGRYILRDEIDRGGMGAVFRAYDPTLDREVAIKVIGGDEGSAELRSVLRREARVVARMDHPAIVPVYDFGHDPETRVLFFVMPLLRGVTLRDVLARGPLTVATTVRIGMHIAEALAYSHELGIVHRDIKPENVMLVSGAHDPLRVKIMDFGLALRTHDPTQASGSLVGTIGYLSPEQERGGPVDARTDVYALGAVLYECLTGTLPSESGRRAGRARVPYRPSTSTPNIPPELDTLVVACLQPSPDHRPQNAFEILEALQAVPVTEEPDLSFLPTRPGAERHLTPIPVDRRRSSLPSLRRPLSVGDLLLVHGEYAAAVEAFAAARMGAADADGTVSPADEVAYRVRLANVCHKLGRYEEAVEHCATGLQLVDAGMPVAAAELHAWAALAHAAAGRLGQALVRIDAGEACIRPLETRTPGVNRVWALLWRARANLFLAEGKFDGAIEACRKAIEHAETIDGRWERSIARFNLGDALSLAGRHGEALIELDQAYVEKATIGDRWGLGYVHHARFRVHFDQGRIDVARREARAGLVLAREVSDPKLIAMLEVASGRLAFREGRFEEAAALAVRAIDAARPCGARAELVLGLILQAHASLAMERLDDAIAHASEARSLARRTRLHADWSIAERTLAIAYTRRGRPVEAGVALREARRLVDLMGNPFRILEVDLAEVAMKLDADQVDGRLEATLNAVIRRSESLQATTLTERGKTLMLLLRDRLGGAPKAADTSATDMLIPTSTPREA